ncbi:MAG: 16S rRNA (guanine(527)-N(7))-methyltransferase RsmG [Deltaproteobacteria bacterium]|jgi:16S rRNA (guanine(527)-N(7))-methyltransferase RsmG|nr:16S rRNA (guanine(527)-N(7))-methyltransferase RsmG [Deltaproteobacteria bacterium]
MDFHLINHPLILSLHNTKQINNLENSLQLYYQTLVKWNKKINLVSRKENDHLYHFVDSINFSCLEQLGGSIVDIGSGGGFPGLVCSILRPDLQFTLFEPVQKKVAFLHNLISKLELKNCQLKPVPFANDCFPEKHWNHAVCRAFTNIKDWQKLTENRAQTIWYFASEQQQKKAPRGWESIRSWENHNHGTRYLLRFYPPPMMS